MRTPMTAYVVRDRRAATLVLVGTGVALAVALLLAVVTGSWPSTVVAVVVIAYLAIVQLRSVRERLRVDRYGVSVSDPEVRFRPGQRRYVPWEAVREVVIDGELIVVRLRADASMPMWMKGRVADPASPDAGELRAAVPGLDAAALQQAARDLGVDVPIELR
jgi:hypothetical protein